MPPRPASQDGDDEVQYMHSFSSSIYNTKKKEWDV
jgi:hypothetical protein